MMTGKAPRIVTGTLVRFELPLVVVLGFLHIVQVGEEGRQRSNENAEERHWQVEELLPPMVDTNEEDQESLGRCRERRRLGPCMAVTIGS
jgi:hypothetical protein